MSFTFIQNVQGERDWNYKWGSAVNLSFHILQVWLLLSVIVLLFWATCTQVGQVWYYNLYSTVYAHTCRVSVHTYMYYYSMTCFDSSSIYRCMCFCIVQTCNYCMYYYTVPTLYKFCSHRLHLVFTVHYCVFVANCVEPYVYSCT